MNSVDNPYFLMEAMPGEKSGEVTYLRRRIDELEAENNLLKTSGIIEVAVRNPSLSEYMRHWEGRAEAAENKLAKAVEALDEAVYLLAPDEKDMMRQAGVYRVVTTLAELKGPPVK